MVTWRPRPAQRGVALLLALLAVAVMGMAAAYLVQTGAQEQRRDAEDELLHQGRMLQLALLSYVDSTPGQAALGPRELEDLLRDPRFPGVKRHLRQVPADPLTGRAEWGLQRSPDGQILGVYSLAPGVPIKRTGFEPELGALADAPSYQAWVFGARVLIPAPARSGPSGR